MAALISNLCFGASASVPLAAGVTKTVAAFQAPSRQRVKLLCYGIWFDSSDGFQVPVQVQIIRASALGVGTITGLACNEEELEGLTPDPIQTTGYVDFTVEPTYTTYILKTLTVMTSSGYEIIEAFEQPVIVKPGGIIGIQCLASNVVNARGYMRVEE